MFYFGLKLFSTNRNYISSALKLYDRCVYHYIELYTFPGSYEEFRQDWMNIKIPYVIHAPHYKDGMNLSRKENEKTNMKLAQESFRFADDLKADIVIMHPGTNGDIKETARQVVMLGDERIVLENKPFYGNGENLICNGSSPEDVLFAMEETGAGFCLDMGHAICSANARDLNPIEYIEHFMKLRPKIYHLTDGEYFGLFDRHDHYGEGNFPLERIAGMIPPGSKITNEAVKNSPENLDDYERDMDLLKGMISRT